MDKIKGTLLLGLLTLLFFLPAFISKKVFLPLYIYDQGLFYPPKKEKKFHSIIKGDPVLIFYPEDTLYNEWLKKGVLIKWNPYIFSGYPQFANGQSGFLHPIRLLTHFLFDPLTARMIGLFLHLWMCGTFMFFYLKALNFSFSSSLFGGIVWMFCGHMMTWFEYERTVEAGAMLPLLFLSYENYLSKRSYLYILLGSVAFALSFYSRNINWTLYVCIGFFTYSLLRAMLTIKEKKDVKESIKIIYSFLIISFFGLLLASPLIIPTLELIKLSTNFLRTARHFHPGGWEGWLTLFSTFFMPGIIGTPFMPTDCDIMGSRFFEIQGYMGLIPLYLAILSLFGEKSNFIFLYLIFSLIFLLTALSTPITFLFQLTVPGFNRLHEGRALFLWSFGMGILSASGMEKLNGIDNKKLLFSFLLTFFAGIFSCTITFIIHKKCLPSSWISLSNPLFSLPVILTISASITFFILRKHTLLKISIITFTLLDTGFLGYIHNLPVSKKLADFSSAYINVLKNKTGLYRIAGLEPNLSILFKLYSIEGYESLWPDYYYKLLNPTPPPEFAHIRLDVFSNKSVYPLLRLLGVKLIYSPLKKFPPFVPKDKVEKIYDGDVSIFKLEGVLPRAFLINRFKIMNEEEGRKHMLEEEFIPEDFLILNEPPEENLISVQERYFEEALIVDYSPHRVIIKAHAKTDCFLVLSDMYYPGWKVYVDGRKEKIYRAYNILRAVHIKPGYHTIKFIYSPSSYKIGIFLFLSGLFLLLILMVKNVI
jgi:uncharacterized membrane protein YfhO